MVAIKCNKKVLYGKCIKVPIVSHLQELVYTFPASDRPPGSFRILDRCHTRYMDEGGGLQTNGRDIVFQRNSHVFFYSRRMTPKLMRAHLTFILT